MFVIIAYLSEYLIQKNDCIIYGGDVITNLIILLITETR